MATQRKSTDTESVSNEQGKPLQTDAAANVVAPADGPEYGYVGEAHPDKDRDAYTVAGVTGSTAKAQDTPPSGAADSVRSKWKPLS
jgi:hypothetical protein